MKTQLKYPMKVQAVCSKGQKPRPYLNIPIPLAAAIALEAGEEVEWELLSRGELRLLRPNAPKPKGR
jgi:hypothetical protein